MPAALPLVPVYTGAQLRAGERLLLDAGQGSQLMRRASWGLAGVVLKLLGGRVAQAEDHRLSGSRGLRRRGSARSTIYGARVTGLIGPGNNGGDGLWALSFLRRRGVDVRAVLTRERVHEEALAAFLRAGGRVVDEVPEDTEVVIDAILGTGFRGEFAAPQIPDGALVIACDLPSGVDADTGQVRGSALPAAHTVTFGGLKMGLLAGDGGHLSGRLHTVDIGIGEHLPEPRAYAVSEGAPVRPAPPQATDHKYSRGTLHILAGSQHYPGAAQLAVGAAVSTGVGMVTFEGPEEVRRQVLAAWPEAVHSAEDDQEGLDRRLGKARAVVVGPGLGEEPAQRQRASEIIRWAVRERRPCVVDASALAVVPHLELGPEVLLTPHAGEARSLAGQLGLEGAGELLGSDPVGVAESLARRTGAAVLLKGATTVIASPEGEVLLHRAQAPGLATAGSGDVLSGILGAVLATQTPELSLVQCAALAVRLHAGAAARLDPEGEGGFGASALLPGPGVS